MDIMQLSLEPYTKEKRFSRPKMFHARFPKGFMFIKVTMPKRYMLGKMDNTFCHTMTTYQNSEFCRVSLGTTWILNEITCVIRYVSSIQNYIYTSDLSKNRSIRSQRGISFS